MLPPAPPRRFLFLQGPSVAVFTETGARLRELGHKVWRINFCLGDWLLWHGPGCINFRGRLEDWPGFIAGFLDREAVTDLVLLGEQRPYHRIAIEAARQRGVQVAVVDYGYLRPDWVTLERDGMGAESRFPRDPGAILALAEGLPPVDFAPRYRDSFFHQALGEVIYHWSSLLPWPFPHYRRFMLHHPLAAHIATVRQLLRRGRENRRAAAILEAQRGRPLWLFAMQMETDYSIRAYSDFPDMDAALAATVRSFARAAPADAGLLVKVHPLDPGLKNWRRRVARIAAAAGVAERVHYLGGALPAEPVIRACRGVVTVNSTLGIGALAMGCPVHPLGRAIYAVPGLSWLGPLDDFWRQAPPPEPRLADAFLRGIAACLQVRGVGFAQPGRAAAVEGVTRRLHLNLLNQPLHEDGTPVP